MRYAMVILASILLLLGCAERPVPKNCIDSNIAERYRIKACGNFTKSVLMEENPFIKYSSSSKNYAGGLELDSLYVGFEFEFKEGHLRDMFITYGSSYGINGRARIEKQVREDRLFFGSGERFVKNGLGYFMKVHDRSNALDVFIEINFPDSSVSRFQPEFEKSLATLKTSDSATATAAKPGHNP